MKFGLEHKNLLLSACDPLNHFDFTWQLFRLPQSDLTALLAKKKKNLP